MCPCSHTRLPGVVARSCPTSRSRSLAAAGLVALEVDHRDHDDAERARLLGLARDLDLLVTGSSDYHGAGKPNRLGEHTTHPDVLESILERGRLPLVR